MTTQVYICERSLELDDRPIAPALGTPFFWGGMSVDD